MLNIISIYDLPENKETLAKKLSAAMKSTVYEALARLKAPGRGPFVVGTSASVGQAEDIVARLSAHGFHSVLLKNGDLEDNAVRFAVCRLRLTSDALIAESVTEESLAMDFSSIRLLLRGISISETTSTDTVKEKKFSAGTALMTAGLKMTRTTEKIIENTTQEREGFLHLYGRERQTLVFREERLVYDSLGPALQPTRQANFSYLIRELRRLSTGAVYDDRLLSRAGQVQLLGPSLSPEKHLDIAISLLAKLLV